MSGCGRCSPRGSRRRIFVRRAGAQRVDLDLATPVARMPARDDVEAAQELAVGHDDRRRASVEHHAIVDRHATRDPPVPRAQTIRREAEHDHVHREQVHGELTAVDGQAVDEQPVHGKLGGGSHGSGGSCAGSRVGRGAGEADREREIGAVTGDEPDACAGAGLHRRREVVVAAARPRRRAARSPAAPTARPSVSSRTLHAGPVMPGRARRAEHAGPLPVMWPGRWRRPRPPARRCRPRRGPAGGSPDRVRRRRSGAGGRRTA